MQYVLKIVYFCARFVGNWHVFDNFLEQASQRGGKFLVRVDEEAGRCYLQGGAILVMAGVAGIRWQTSDTESFGVFSTWELWSITIFNKILIFVTQLVFWYFDICNPLDLDSVKFESECQTDCGNASMMVKTIEYTRGDRMSFLFSNETWFSNDTAPTVLAICPIAFSSLSKVISIP